VESREEREESSALSSPPATHKREKALRHIGHLLQWAMNQGDVECLAYVDVQLRQDTELKWKTKVGGPNWTFQELGDEVDLRAKVQGRS